MNTTTQELATLTPGAQITIEGRGYTVESQIDLAKLPRLAEIADAILVLKGKRGATAKLDAKRNGHCFLTTRNACRDIDLEEISL